MDYQFWNEIHARGGIPAVKSALDDLADRVGPEAPGELDAAVELACQVIADDTARLQARADQAEARLASLTSEAREVQRRTATRADAQDDTASPASPDVPEGLNGSGDPDAP